MEKAKDAFSIKKIKKKGETAEIRFPVYGMGMKEFWQQKRRMGIIRKITSGLWAKKKKKAGGFDGLIVTIGLVLIVMILIYVFKTVLATQVDNSIQSVAEEVSGITSWDTGTTN